MYNAIGITQRRHNAARRAGPSAVAEACSFCTVCDLVLAVGGRSVLSDEKRLIKHLLDHYERVGVIG